MTDKFQVIAAEYSRFSRELSELDAEWARYVIMRMQNAENDFSKLHTEYADYLQRFQAMVNTFDSIMERLNNEITALKAVGKVPFSIARLKSNLLKFNRDHKVESHLKSRVQTMTDLIELSVAA